MPATAVDRLKAACGDMAVPVQWDLTVDEDGAALLLGKSAFTLRNWRHTSRPLAFVKIGGRIRYELAEIARFMAEAKDLDE